MTSHHTSLEQQRLVCCEIVGLFPPLRALSAGHSTVSSNLMKMLISDYIPQNEIVFCIAFVQMPFCSPTFWDGHWPEALDMWLPLVDHPLL